MKRKLILILVSLLLALPLFADNYDISLSFGLDNYSWSGKDFSFSYGANLGVSERFEIDVWGISEILPTPFSKNMFGLDVGYSVIGRRTSGSKIAGAGINMLVSLGGFYITESHGAGPILSITPITVGNPITGRRERLLKTGIGWDFVNNKLIVTFSLMNLDIYVRGTYRDYEY